MKEKIIFSGELKNTELLKSLALNNISSFNVRIMGGAELARYALVKSGITETVKVITGKDSIGIISGIMKDIPYFSDANYQDAVNVQMAVNSLRRIIRSNEQEELTAGLRKGIFKDKNEAIISVYENYMKYLSDNNLMDYIMLIRYATANCARLDAEFVLIKEFEITPAEEELYKVLSGNDKPVYSSFSDLFYDKNLKTDGVNVKSYTNYYGIPGETENIINDIYSKGVSLDKTTVVVCDQVSYSQAFFDIAVLRNIPMTFGAGIPISNSYPGKLLTLYYRWKETGFFGVTYLMDMIFSPYFNMQKLRLAIEEGATIDDLTNMSYSIKKVIERCGNLRLTDNKEKNARIIEKMSGDTPFFKNAVVKVSEMLTLPVSDFIKEYAVIRFVNEKKDDFISDLLRRVDVSSVNYIYSQMEILHGIDNISETEVIPKILINNICRELSKEGFIHITEPVGAFSVIRDNVYIAGLSANIYPGSPKENYLLLDSDYELFEDGQNFTSLNRLIKKKDIMINLVKLYSALSKNIFISYAGHNVSELKEENASSIIFELFRMQYGSSASYKMLEDKIYNADYFQAALGNTGYVGKAYVQDKVIKLSERKNDYDDAVTGAYSDDTAYSPSAMQLYCQCKKKYMYKYVMKVKEPENIDNLAVISPKDEGILAHEVMERAARIQHITTEVIKDIATEVFDQYLANKASIVISDGINAGNNFARMMADAINMVPDGDVILAENELEMRHNEAGVKIKGRPDCVLKKADGKCTIIDYKTGYEKKHIENDILTCLQGVIYAYLVEQTGEEIDGIEYRYLRLNETVKCSYDADMKNRLANGLISFKNMLIAGRFDRSNNTEQCETCGYAAICKANKES